MAGVEFKVDAKLGDVTAVQDLLNQVKQGATLRINTTQASQRIQAIQKQINTLKQSMNGLGLNFGGGNGGGGNANKGQVGANLTANQQFQTSTSAVSDVQKVINSLNSQVDGTVSKLKLCTDETGKIVGGTAEITKGATTWTRTIEQARDANGEIIEGQYKLTEAGKLTLDNTKKYNGSLTQQIKMQTKQYAIYYATSAVIQGITSAIADCVDYTVDLDKAMTNIRVVTMDTKEATQDLLKSYNQMGQELGANTLDIAEGAVDWLRQGFSEEDTTKLVESSTVLSKLALIDNAQATEYLTSALKGYKLEAKDAMGVIDQLTAIDLEAATSAGDMAEAIK